MCELWLFLDCYLLCYLYVLNFLLLLCLCALIPFRNWLLLGSPYFHFAFAFNFFNTGNNRRGVVWCVFSVCIHDFLTVLIRCCLYFLIRNCCFGVVLLLISRVVCLWVQYWFQFRVWFYKFVFHDLLRLLRSLQMLWTSGCYARWHHIWVLLHIEIITCCCIICVQAGCVNHRFY